MPRLCAVHFLKKKHKIFDRTFRKNLMLPPKRTLNNKSFVIQGKIKPRNDVKKGAAANLRLVFPKPVLYTNRMMNFKSPLRLFSSLILFYSELHEFLYNYSGVIPYIHFLLHFCKMEKRYSFESALAVLEPTSSPSPQP